MTSTFQFSLIHHGFQKLFLSFNYLLTRYCINKNGTSIIKIYFKFFSGKSILVFKNLTFGIKNVNPFQPPAVQIEPLTKIKLNKGSSWNLLFRTGQLVIWFLLISIFSLHLFLPNDFSLKGR